MIHFTLKRVLIQKINRVALAFLAITVFLNLCYLARSLQGAVEVVAWLDISLLALVSTVSFFEDSFRVKAFTKTLSLFYLVVYPFFSKKTAASISDR